MAPTKITENVGWVWAILEIATTAGAVVKTEVKKNPAIKEVTKLRAGRALRILSIVSVWLR